MMAEIWKSVPGYEGRYEVSDQGNVRQMHKSARLPALSLLGLSTQGNGYKFLWLTSPEQKKNFTVHRLVMLAFVGERPTGMIIDHINGIRSDNRLTNLRYVSQQRNVQAGKSTPLTPENILEIRELLKTGLTQKAIGKRFGVSQRAIGNIHQGLRWSNIVSPESAS